MPPSHVTPAAAAAPSRGSGGGGSLKRKLSELEIGESCYADQRQSVLNMSMVKLNSAPARRTEQSLRRSVLIYNTLKHIETQLYSEGVSLNPAATKPCLLPGEPHPALTLDPHPEGSPPPSSSSSSSRSTATPPACAPCDMDTSEPPHPARGAQDSSDSERAAEAPVVPPSEVDCSDTRSLLDSFFTAASSRLNMASFASLFEQDNSSKAQVSLPTSCQGSSATATAASPAPVQSACPPKNNSPSVCHGSSSSSEQDSLADLDLAWLDFDLSPLPSAVKQLPSLSVEDLSHSLLLPGAHEPILPLATTPSCNPKKDLLLSEDLDHVMEILVGM